MKKFFRDLGTNEKVLFILRVIFTFFVFHIYDLSRSDHTFWENTAFLVSLIILLLLCMVEGKLDKD